MSSQPGDDVTLYAAVGGMPFFEALVGAFYDRVEADQVLRAVYPGEDLGPARHRLTLFLAQYWGGPDDYDSERGAPRDTMATIVSCVLPRPVVSPCQATLSRPSRYRHRPAVRNGSPSSAA